MSEAGGWIQQELEEGTDVLYLTGAWRLAHLPAIADALRALRPKGGSCFVLDGSRLEELDTAAGFILYSRLAALGCDESKVSARGFDARHERLLTLVHQRMLCPPATAKSTHPGLVQHVGAAAIALWRLLKVHQAFV